MSKRRSKQEADHTRQVKVMMNMYVHDRAKIYADSLGMSFSFFVEQLIARQLKKVGQ